MALNCGFILTIKKKGKLQSGGLTNVQEKIQAPCTRHLDTSTVDSSASSGGLYGTNDPGFESQTFKNILTLVIQ